MPDEQLARIEETLTGLVTGLGGLRADVGALTTDVSGLRTDVGALTTDLSGLRGDVSVLTTDLSGLRGDVSVLTTNVARLDAKIDEQGARQDVFETSMRNSIAQVESHLSDMHAYMVFADNRVREEAQEGLRRHDARFDTMDRRFDRLEQKLGHFIDTQGSVNLDVEIRLRAVERPD